MLRESLKVIILILILISFFAGVLVYTIRNSDSCRKLECITMENQGDFQIQEVYRDENNIYRALLSNKDDLLRVEIRPRVSQEEADQYTDSQITRMKALFSKGASPYPGVISYEIECSEEFLPNFEVDEISGIRISHFAGYLNERLVAGACTEDQAVYKEIFTLFYCPKQRRLFQLEIIAPKEKFRSSPEVYESMFKSLACADY